MKLYHGSYTDIEVIDLKKSLKGKDFGQGFYLSRDITHAHNIAQIRSISLRCQPVINVYEFDDSKLLDGTLKVKTFDAYSHEWAEFILANRNNLSDNPIHDFDIVIGPIANDRVGQQIRKYTDGEITLNQFMDQLKYMKGLTIQYFFGTQASINQLIKLPSI